VLTLTPEGKPRISSYQFWHNSVILYGTNLETVTDGWEVSAVFKGVKSTSCEIKETHATITWYDGVPTSNEEAEFFVVFSSDDDDIRIWVGTTEVPFVHTNPLALTDYTANILYASLNNPAYGIVSSYMGGNFVEIGQQSGLTATFKKDSVNNMIKVCDIECIFDAEQSDDSHIVCEIPSLTTIYSAV
jgi:hypothetical protein